MQAQPPLSSALPIFIYEVQHAVATRSGRSVSKEAKLPMRNFYEGELICGDLVEPSKWPGSKNGPYVRLAEADGGWLFERKKGDVILKRVSSQRGLWVFRVVNSAGIALRRHPIDCAIRNRGRDRSPQVRVKPDVVYPPGYTLLVDVKVVSRSGVEFYRVQGTCGWVFTKRRDRVMMEQVSLARAYSEAIHSKEGKEENSKDVALDVEVVRSLARGHGLKEIQFNEASRVIAFRKDCEEGAVRINVYYSTGTVGTALLHPVQGKTQLFRKQCDLRDLINVFENPRWHSGRGYKRRRIAEDESTASQVEAKPFLEERFALHQSLFQIGAEIEDLVKSRESILERLAETEHNRLEYATAEMKKKEAERQRKLAEEKALKEKALAEEKARREREARALARQKRGDLVCYSIYKKLHFEIDGDTRLVAISGSDCVLAIYTDDSYTYTSGLPCRLHELLHSRARHHPYPEVVAMGSMDRFFVRFSNGKSEWDVCGNDEIRDLLHDEDVDDIAFGSDEFTYVALTSSGVRWNGDIPSRLESHLYHSSRAIQKVALGPEREWFIAFKDGGFDGGGFGPELHREWQDVKRDGQTVRDLVFGSNGTYVMRSSVYSGSF